MYSVSISKIKYETEGPKAKIFNFNNNVIGLAGNVDDITLIKSLIEEKKQDVIEFTKSVSKIMKDRILEMKDAFIMDLTLHTREEFIRDPQGHDGTVPSEIKGIVYSNIPLIIFECECIIAGFDSEGIGKIFRLDMNGDYFDHSELFNYSIGSGAPFSMIYFDQQNFNYKCSLAEGLYFAYMAKLNAEAHVGVGPKTDIYILNKDKTPIYISDESDKIKLLNDYLINDRENTQNFRKGIFEKIDEMINE